MAAFGTGPTAGHARDSEPRATRWITVRTLSHSRARRSVIVITMLSIQEVPSLIAIEQLPIDLGKSCNIIAHGVSIAPSRLERQTPRRM